ncbi:MAG: 50S ribosomal protein L33 [Polyangiaceae bacterium]|nr:50S ribosomal protein L33 [Polyangiaceae bacterium]
MSARAAGPKKTQKARTNIVLACSVCGARNYKSTKARREGAEMLQLKKFCSACNAHTLHIESK